MKLDKAYFVSICNSTLLGVWRNESLRNAEGYTNELPIKAYFWRRVLYSTALLLVLGVGYAQWLGLKGVKFELLFIVLLITPFYSLISLMQYKSADKKFIKDCEQLHDLLCVVNYHSIQSLRQRAHEILVELGEKTALGSTIQEIEDSFTALKNAYNICDRFQLVSRTIEHFVPPRNVVSPRKDDGVSARQ